MRVRWATEADVAALARVYEDAVRGQGGAHYGPDQVEAWAAFASDGEAFSSWVLDAETILLEDESGVFAFAALGPGGHITATYVRSDRARSGHGTRLLETVLERGREQGITTFRAEASEVSRKLFASFGFRMESREEVERNGVVLHRYRMVLAEDPSQDPDPDSREEER